MTKHLCDRCGIDLPCESRDISDVLVDGLFNTWATDLTGLVRAEINLFIGNSDELHPELCSACEVAVLETIYKTASRKLIGQFPPAPAEATPAATS